SAGEARAASVAFSAASVKATGMDDRTDERSITTPKGITFVKTKPRRPVQEAFISRTLILPGPLATTKSQALLSSHRRVQAFRILRAAANSCGAATRRWPTASAVGWSTEHRSREAAEEGPPGPRLCRPLTGLSARVHFPHGSRRGLTSRATPWLTARSPVVQILICRPPILTDASPHLDAL